MKKTILLLMLVSSMLLLSGCNSFYWKENSTEECVKDKWIKGKDNDQKYLVGMKSDNVYQIVDSLMKWQWRSSDIYNKIEIDKCYRITYFGWRIGFFSTYRNILTADEITSIENINYPNGSIQFEVEG